MNTEQIVLASKPKGLPGIDNFRIEKIELPKLNDGEVLLQGMYYSVDPYMRGRMNSTSGISKPIEGGVVAKVIESKTKDFNSGDIVTARLPWRLQTVSNAKLLQRVEPSNVPLSYYLGILGMPGLTAYFGLTEVGKPKRGETVVVSGAAGAVGSVVGQIAKILGCTVLGIAGSDEKVKMLKEELGFDQAINYKVAYNLQSAIAELCPKGIDVYFDNVGGEISDAVLPNLNAFARVPVCGQISTYNSNEISMGPRVQPLILSKWITMQGFSSSHYETRFPEGVQQLMQWVKEGKLKYKETIKEDFHQLPDALIGLFKGENMGKMIVKA